ncbi:Sodium/hydrogen exchanger isoform 1 [Hibiscus syriacus]|uniref:Sodium/hydrogen exchanger isoform 1 n=1 Tax=Hibiscus syriacus TaxID=106335 RepID=A0A6A3BX16_HIBSY|nr:Sodium/hydrogen exchanger isoform 1 [Hibiscus syriacus]
MLHMHFRTNFNSTTEDIVLPETTQVQLHNEGTAGCQRTTFQFHPRFQLHDGGYRATRDNTSSTSQRRDSWLSTNIFQISEPISTSQRRILDSRQHKFNFTTKGRLIVNKISFIVNFNFTVKDIRLETAQAQLHSEGAADCQQTISRFQNQFQLHSGGYWTRNNIWISTSLRRISKSQAQLHDEGALEEIEKLKEVNEAQKAQIIEKDELKKEVIRQLSLAVEMLKDENMELKKSIAKAPPLRKWSPLDFNKVKGGLFGMLFKGSPKSGPSVVAL